MKKIILVIALVSALPALVMAEEKKMQNTNPSPAVKPEHVMQNTNPSPEQMPEHVMNNTNPNATSSGDKGGSEPTEKAVDIQHLPKEK